MPRTDVVDERGLSRLQGIDLREHADQNVAHDCVNLRLDHASRLTNYPRPTKVKSGAYYFACESKNPSLQEFDFSLDGFFGKPTITRQTKADGGKKTKLVGTNLRLIEKVVLVAEDGTCIESGQDFGYEVDNEGNLLLDVYWSSYAYFQTLILINSYGTYSVAVDVSEAYNNILVFGNTFRMGIDNQTLEFCIWKHSQTNGWEKIVSWGMVGVEWIESANSLVNVDFFAIQDEHGAFAFMPNPSTTNQPLYLIYNANPEGLDWLGVLSSGTPIQEFGNATTGYSPDFNTPFAAYEGRYDFGEYGSYRLQISNGTLKLLGKTDYQSDVYDITLQEWSGE